MERVSIKDLKEQFRTGDINEEMITELKSDERKGVQQLIASYERRKQKEQLLEANFFKMLHYENENYKKGIHCIAGVDEAGRGPLAGPVVAAAVILPKDFKLLGLTDSKQLNEKQRNEFYEKIVEEAVSYHVAIISNQEIDRINIFEATKKAMYTAIDQLNPQADHVLIDAVELNGLAATSEVIVKGDLKSITIAAASILAKVTRDRLMRNIHTKYPMYHFDSNMGYGTKQHLDMLAEHGATPYHRQTFSPVRQVMKQ